MRTVAVLASVLVWGTIAGAAQKVCNVRQFGAKGDGVSKDTAAIQQAIDACAVPDPKLEAHQSEHTHVVHATPRVVLGGNGTFVSGPLSLRSNEIFVVEKGSTLLGSPDREDFGMTKFARLDTVAPLLGAVNAHDIVIEGGGVIDGNGHVWWEYVKGVKDAGVLGNDHPRPMGVVFDHTQHVRVENVTVQNAGFWQIVPYYADDVVVRNVRILAPHSPNTDAIDPFSSSNLTIEHVFSSVGDDNIAIKSGAINSPGPDAPSKNITITDCTFEEGHGLSIGSEIAGGAQNIRAERIHFKGTDQGIRIKANRDRGADVSNIRFKDITMVDVKTAILISEYYPKVAPAGDVAAAPVTRLTPFFHDIVIENVQATGSSVAGVVVGLPEAPVKDLTLRNVKIDAAKGMTFAYANVVTQGLSVTAADGSPYTMGPGANVSGVAAAK